MKAQRLLFRTLVILCGCISFAACHGNKPAIPGNGADKAAVTTFRARLDTLTQIEDDSARSEKIRSLFSAAPPYVRNTVCTDVLPVMVKTLFFNPDADTALLPYYRRLSADTALSIKNRCAVNLQLASFYVNVVGDADSASWYLDRVSGVQAALDDTLKAHLFGISAQVYQARGSLKKASASLYKSASYYEKIKDSQNVAGTNVNLANVYRNMNDFNKAIELRKKAVSFFGRKQNDKLNVIVFQGLASDFLEINQIDSARKYMAKAEALFAKGVRNAFAEYFLYLSKAGMYVTLKRYDSSVLYFDKAKVLLVQLGDDAQKMLFTIASSIAYSHERNVSREAALIEAYIPQLLKDGNIQRARDAYYSLYNISLTQRIGREPIDYYQSYDSLRAVLADQSNRDYAAEMDSKYESQKKNLKIGLQQKELEQRKALNLILILCTVLILVGGGLFVARLQLLRIRKEARLQQQYTLSLLKNTEDERRRIAGELHDGIGHELLSLKTNLHKGVTTAEAGIDMIINDVRMISRNLHPVMLDQIGLEYSVKHLCDQAMNSGHLFVTAEIDYHLELSPDDELQLYRIIQESLTNVIKYANAVAAKITILAENGLLTVTVMDNGTGFDMEEKIRSGPAFGLNSILQRGKALGGKISISSSPQGTIINLDIPLHHAVHNNS